MSQVYGVYSAYGICTMQCYSVFTGHRPLSFAATFVNPEHVMLNKISQAQKDKKPHDLIPVESRKAAVIEGETRGIVNGSWSGWGLVQRGWQKDAPGFSEERRVSLGD